MPIEFLFLFLLVLVIVEVPVAFAMTISAFLFLVLDGQVPLQIVVQRIAPGLDSFPLLAIPLFVLAGNILNSAGIAHRIFDFALALFGHIRGSLAHVNVVASIIFAGMSGVAQADAAGLGTIEIEAMERNGFERDFSAAVTAASSIIGPIIPPSTIMVMYAVQADASLSELFLAGVVPGLLMGALLMGTVYFLAVSGRVAAPVLPRADWPRLWKTFIRAFPGMLAPVFLVGGLLTGVATPTELGALIVLYAAILGLITKDLNLSRIWDCALTTFTTCGVLVFIIAASVPFGWLMAMNGVPQMLADAMMGMTSNKYLILILINFGLLILGCFMETAALLMIAVPVLAPLLMELQVDPVHFGIIIILNLMIGANTPPFGVILFVMMEVAKIPFNRMVKAFMPFYVPLAILLILITFFPTISLWLPKFIEGPETSGKLGTEPAVKVELQIEPRIDRISGFSGQEHGLNIVLPAGPKPFMEGRRKTDADYMNFEPGRPISLAQAIEGNLA